MIMKNKLMFAALLAMTLAGFCSCKKDYTCTCTTTVASISTTTTHDLQNQRITDATEACERFENDANNGGIGTTNCHL